MRKICTVPSVIEEVMCSSEYCANQFTERRLSVLSVVFDRAADECFRRLSGYLEDGDIEDQHLCLMELELPSDKNNVSPNAFIYDADISKKGPLCSGLTSRRARSGPHLFIEVIGSEESLPGDGGDVGVMGVVKCCLKDVRTELVYKGNNYTLRGIVTFTPPARTTDFGHFQGYARRCDSTWEVLEKQNFNSSS
ncbi:uncharacterized protein LOC120353091 [Nilaparvata lugens]|uniref:uncharacterized protein LOC120353091 n=1 Tax=Nilaparvata lugens TaxID=108931 RepID=UPI00193DF25A|nr:uncharacterized protein LOC120353091 [Nilaparvata lugens]